jgi:hypothetical protein
VVGQHALQVAGVNRRGSPLDQGSDLLFVVGHRSRHTHYDWGERRN